MLYIDIFLSDHSSNPPLPEDSRISTILRRLAREDDENKFVTLGKNLQVNLFILVYSKSCFELLTQYYTQQKILSVMIRKCYSLGGVKL